MDPLLQLYPGLPVLLVEELAQIAQSKDGTDDLRILVVSGTLGKERLGAGLYIPANE